MVCACKPTCVKSKAAANIHKCFIYLSIALFDYTFSSIVDIESLGAGHDDVAAIDGGPRSITWACGHQGPDAAGIADRRLNGVEHPTRRIAAAGRRLVDQEGDDAQMVSRPLLSQL